MHVWKHSHSYGDKTAEVAGIVINTDHGHPVIDLTFRTFDVPDDDQLVNEAKSVWKQGKLHVVEEETGSFVAYVPSSKKITSALNRINLSRG